MSVCLVRSDTVAVPGTVTAYLVLCLLDLKVLGFALFIIRDEDLITY
jgi:hypothetical protein